MSGGSSDPAEAFDPVAFLADAVRVPSNEDVIDMRDLLLATLAEYGVDAEVVDGSCVVAEKTSPNPEAGPHLVFNTHIDTVSPHIPFERGPCEGGECPPADGAADSDSTAATEVIRGRGSCDAKGPLAALLAAFLRAEPERGRVTLAITPDEEVLSLGAAELLGLLPGSENRLSDADCVVVGEPTGLDVCTAAKGRFQGTLHLSGVAAHAAEFAGVNAVAAAEDALCAVRTFDDDAETHPQLGDPKLTPTVIEGGESTNQVPADCELVLDRRSVPPETAEGFRSSLVDAVRGEVADGVGVEFALTDRESPFFEAFSTDTDHELVRTMANAASAAVNDRDAPGVSADGGGDVRPFGAATEASYFAPVPTVVFGPGDLADDAGAVAHAEREYVRVPAVEAAAAAVTRAVDGLLG
ncbi:hypothetical protein JCM17823_08890 [Halorubrum gandharaense]